MKKIGLIIQGPLISIGKDGQKAHVKKKGIHPSDITHYDCRENIHRLINDFGSLFETIVISTWDNELKPEDKWQDTTIVSSPDPGEVQRNEYDHRSRNKYRQFQGIKNGLLILKQNPEINYAIRIRTDQYLDLKKLVESFITQTDKNGAGSEKIYVPFTRPADFMVHDIYLASHIDVFNKFCNAVLAFDMFEFINCVHRDMVLKHAYVCYRNKINVSDIAYFPWWPPCAASSDTKKIFSYMFEHIYTPLAPEIYRSVEWRGSKFSEVHIQAQHLDIPHSQLRRKNILNAPSLVSIDLERYFAFKRDTHGRKSSFFDPIISKIGKKFWLLWNHFRNFSKRIKVTDLVYRLLR